MPHPPAAAAARMGPGCLFRAGAENVNNSYRHPGHVHSPHTPSSHSSACSPCDSVANVDVESPVCATATTLSGCRPQGLTEVAGLPHPPAAAAARMGPGCLFRAGAENVNNSYRHPGHVHSPHTPSSHSSACSPCDSVANVDVESPVCDTATTLSGCMSQDLTEVAGMPHPPAAAAATATTLSPLNLN